MIIDEKNQDSHQIYEECKSSPYKTFDNANAAENWGKTSFAAWRSKLTIRQELVLRKYKNSMLFAKAINMKLRRGVSTSLARLLDTALRQGSLPDNVIVSRNSCLKFLADNGYPSIALLEKAFRDGEKIILLEPGFMSTSLHNKTWKDITKVRLLLKAPKGCRCGFINTKSFFTKQEKELLFASGYAMEVETVKTYNNSKNVLIVARIAPKSIGVYGV